MFEGSYTKQTLGILPEEYAETMHNISFSSLLVIGC